MVVDEERRHEHPVEQEVLVGAVEVECAVDGDVAEVGVGDGVAGAVGADVAEPVRAAGFCRDDRLGRHRVEAEVTTADLDVGVGGLDDRTDADHRDPPPRLLGGEEPPIVQHVAGDGVGDVVGGEREAFDLQPYLAGCQLLLGWLGDAGGAEVRSVDLEDHAATVAEGVAAAAPLTAPSVGVRLAWFGRFASTTGRSERVRFTWCTRATRSRRCG